MAPNDSQSQNRKFPIKIDGKTYTVDDAQMSGKQLLELAKQTPYDNFLLYLHSKDDTSRIVQYDEIVDLSHQGLERFSTIPKKQTEG